MTKSITNKQLIEKLSAYFETQDPKVIARTLANAMIDLNRVLIYTKLPNDEANRFRERLRLNQEMLEDFIENGPDGDLILVNLAPKEKD